MQYGQVQASDASLARKFSLSEWRHHVMVVTARCG